MNELVPSIQAMRALAAGLIVLLHGSSIVAKLTGQSLWQGVEAAVTPIGHGGVDIFFVISGAIMFMITQGARDTNRASVSASFLVRRAARIYPLYLVALAFTMLVAGLMPTWRDVVLITAPAEFGVAWTLLLEVRFYLMVSLLLLAPARFHLPAFLAWCAAEAIYVALGAFGYVDPSPWLFSHPCMLEFVFGVVIGALLTREVMSGCRLAIAFGLGGLVVSWLACWFYPSLILPWRAILYGVPGALLFYGIVALDMSKGLKVPRALTFTGDISYSLYLWHIPVLLLLSRYWPLPQNGELFLIVGLALLVGVSYASYRWIELPSVAAGRGIVSLFRRRSLA